ncbi:MAG: TRAP transporter large permease subunit [Burkholderiales bacterium]|nr:TRAP transporter large permease subunit [Burkholderiales bacterium]
MLESMGLLFGHVRGGLAVSTVVVGMLLAASTGVVGASVVTMGLIALPVMLKYHYDKQLASGVICASGTLGQIIPPSIVLIILGDVLHQPVGDFYRAALLPGLLLVVLYIFFCLAVAYLNKDSAPPLPRSTKLAALDYWRAFKTIVPALMLVVVVLGTVIAGVATPTESAAMGAVGAIILALLEVARVFNAASGCNGNHENQCHGFYHSGGRDIFSMVFTYTVAMKRLKQLWCISRRSMGFCRADDDHHFLAGFFIDFVEIAYIFVPMIAPVLLKLGIDPLWFSIQLLLNLQASFLTPPFGFSLFYLRGVASEAISTMEIYRGVIPFIFLQLIALVIVMLFPGIVRVF